MAPLFARRARRLGFSVDDVIARRGIDASADEVEIACRAAREACAAIAERAGDPHFGIDAALDAARAYGLATGERSVSDVALLLGYADGRAFARAFRRWTKMTPLAWRARHRPARASSLSNDSRVTRDESLGARALFRTFP